MKKLLITLCLAVALTFGCAVAPKVTEPTRSPYVEFVEKTYKNIKIVSYKEDDLTVFMWVNDVNIPGSCDYVVVFQKMGGLDPKTGLGHLKLITKWDKGADAYPCAYGTEMYEEYLFALEQDGGA